MIYRIQCYAILGQKQSEELDCSYIHCERRQARNDLSLYTLWKKKFGMPTMRPA